MTTDMMPELVTPLEKALHAGAVVTPVIAAVELVSPLDPYAVSVLTDAANGHGTISPATAADGSAHPYVQTANAISVTSASVVRMVPTIGSPTPVA
jgi:hypothetical protein